jgi:hypothetical protein
MSTDNYDYMYNTVPWAVKIQNETPRQSIYRR